MTNEEWDTFAMLLDKGFKWKEPFGPAHEFTYRTLLDGYEPEQIAAVLRMLVARGQVFGPTPGEIVAAIRKDPGAPTFEEAYRLIFGAGGVLRARLPYDGPVLDPERRRDAAARARMAEIHPLVASFVDRYGQDRLRMLEVDHPDYGDLKRKELREAWDRHCEAMEGREVAALASGRRDGLRAFDPLTAIGGGVRRELGAGE